MAFHFPLMPRMYMAIAPGGPASDHRHPAPDAGDPGHLPVGDLPAQPRRADARDGDRRASATISGTPTPPTRARGINLGIRRRLAPLLDNDRRKIELMNALLLSMPGTPVVYYGDEIGMGDNIYLGDRDGVRTPMQWSPDRNGGFSRADRQRLYLPPIMDPIYGYQAVNVEAQQREPVVAAQLDAADDRGAPGSTRPSAAARCALLYPRNRKVLAYLREHEGERILCVANLARSAQAVELDLGAFKACVPVELLGRSRVPADRRAALPADPAGLRLLLVRARRGGRAAALARADAGAAAGVHHARAARRLARRRSKAGAGASSSARSCRPSSSSSAGSAPRTGRSPAPGSANWAELGGGRDGHLLAEIEVGARRRRGAAALLPAARDQLGRAGPEPRLAAPRRSRSRQVRRGAKVGVLYDATGRHRFPLAAAQGDPRGGA